VKVSVVICTYNRKEALRVTLDALRYLRYRDFEVIVVLGPCTDGSEEMLAAYLPDIKLTHCDITNLSKARNIGIAQASGDIVAFLDDDGIPEPDWLDKLVRGYHSARIGGVGGFIRNHTGLLFQAQVVVCDRYGDNQGFPSPEAAGAIHRPGTRRYFSLTGCNSSFRRAVLEEIGGFDEEYAYFLDETDVCLRVVEAGYDLEMAGAAQVLHKYAASHLRNAERLPTSLFYPARSKAYFCMKFALPGEEDAARQRVADYLAETSGDMRTLHLAGKIDTATRDRLIQELEKGVEEGVADAAAHPEGQHTLRRYQPPAPPVFKPFPPLRAAEERLRLALVSREYHGDAVGGIAVWTRLVAEGLARRGHEVTVITRAAEGQDPTVDVVNNVWVHRISAPSFTTQSNPPLPDLPDDIRAGCYAVYNEVLRIAAHRGLDLVSFPIWDLEGLACASSGRFRTVMSLHTTYGLALPHKPEWQRNATIRAALVDKMIAAERHALQSGIPLLANSRSVLADIESCYGLAAGTATVVPHGLKDAARTTIADESPRALNVLYVGRFEYRKGIDLLLDAIPQLAAAHPELTFTLVGENRPSTGEKDYKGEFERRHAGASWMERVRFAGAVSAEALEQAYRACDIFVAPSRYESFGLIFVEAAVFAKTVIGPDVGGVKEIITDGVNGLLFAPGDAQALAAALHRAVENAELRRTLAEAARRRYEEEYTSELMIERLETYYLRQARATA